MTGKFDTYISLKSLMQKLFTSNLFWRCLPFVISAVLSYLLGWRLEPKSEDNSGLLIFVLIIFITSLPFFTSLSYMLQIGLLAKLLKIPPELCDTNPRLRYLIRKSAKWGPITLLTWITVFLAIASIPITLSIKERFFEGSKLVIERQPASLSPGSKNYDIIESINFLIFYLFPFSILGLILGAFTLIFSLIRTKTANERKVPRNIKVLGITSVIVFVLPIILSFILSFPLTSIVRREVKKYLYNLPSTASVKINGTHIENPDLIIKELEMLYPLPAHHSHPLNLFRIEIKDANDGLTLFIGRDSSDPNEYWIFYPGFESTYNNEIGRIVTSVFDDY